MSAPRHFGSPAALGIMGLLYHLPNFVKLYVRLWKDRRVSWPARFVLIVGLVYIVSPLDFDWIPMLGQFDDVLVAIAALRGFIWLCPRNVVREHVAWIDTGSRQPPPS